MKNNAVRYQAAQSNADTKSALLPAVSKASQGYLWQLQWNLLAATPH